jgi:hypothetical protein
MRAYRVTLSYRSGAIARVLVIADELEPDLAMIEWLGRINSPFYLTEAEIAVSVVDDHLPVVVSYWAAARISGWFLGSGHMSPVPP